MANAHPHKSSLLTRLMSLSDSLDSASNVMYLSEVLTID